MSKEQQIEEIMLTIPQKIVAYNGDPKGQHLYGEQRLQIAEALYNAGYRKVPENERFVINMKNALEIEKENAVKAFAEHLKKYAIKTNSPAWGLIEFVEVSDIDKLLLTNY